MIPVDPAVSTHPETTILLAQHVRAYLRQIAKQGKPITYQALAEALFLLPPQTIHRLTNALELLVEEDAAAGHPLIAALVISKVRGGLPAPGFFECAQRVGRFDFDAVDQDGAAIYAAEFDLAVAFWREDADK